MEKSVYKLRRALAIGVLAVAPTFAFATSFWGFVETRSANPSTAGIYWTHRTASNGDLETIAVVVNNNGRVSETAGFDENGEMKYGSNHNESETLAEHIARTEGISSQHTWNVFDPVNNDPW